MKIVNFLAKHDGIRLLIQVAILGVLAGLSAYGEIAGGATYATLR